MNTSTSKPITRPISLLLCALGGEGGGVLTQWLIATARVAGFAAQATSIPGVAQRTGATTYYVEVFPTPLAALGGKRPVFSLNPVPGHLDALVSSELLETARQIGNGISAAHRTLVISSTTRALTTQERMVMGDGRIDSERLINVIKTNAKELQLVDMQAMARQAGTIISSVMLGLIAASGLLPFARDHYAQVLAGQTRNLAGFEAGLSALSRHSREGGNPQLNSRSLSLDQITQFATQRLTTYQSAAYASLYQSRLQAIPELQAKQEAARWLALWMCFDDVIWVAHLKSLASRFDRVQSEVGAKTNDLVRVYDHFKPGIPELAGLLPVRLANKLMAWDKARILKGKGAWSMPLKIGSHSITGLLALRLLASFKWLRPLGQRYQEEQEGIEMWLSAIQMASARSAELGVEVAMCGRLVKGYGETNTRAKTNLQHILQLAQLSDTQAAIDAVRQAREAALKDEAGVQLDTLLSANGLPKRPVREVPIQFFRKVKP